MGDVGTVTEPATSRFVWREGDIVVTKRGDQSATLLARMEAADTPIVAAALVVEANAYLSQSEDLVMSSKVRAELIRLELLAAA